MDVPDSYGGAARLMLCASIHPEQRIFACDQMDALANQVCGETGLSAARLGSLLDADEDALIGELMELERGLSTYAGKDSAEALRAMGCVLYLIFSGNRGGPDPDALQAALSQTEPAAISALVMDFSRANPPRSQMHPLVVRALSSIDENYDQELSLKTLAAEYNVSQTYLGRLFKRDTDSLFTAYLTGYRIEKAKEFLLSTSLKSADIAAKTGFSNPNYFANVFKKIVGVYPTRFRQQQRTKE